MGNPSEMSSRIRLPNLIIAGFLVITVFMSYYIMSYYSQNKLLSEKVISASWKLDNTISELTKVEMKLRMCKEKVDTYVQSNKELQAGMAKREEEVTNVSDEKEQLSKNFELLNKFYKEVKVNCFLPLGFFFISLEQF